MLRKRKVILCLGSSCFARGNKELIPMIRKFIERKNLADKVEFKGDHCFDHCSNGPNMMIGTRMFHQVTPENIEQYLKEGLGDL
ncbi:MAG: (2Fe-2S) ferredoxin domain-containing protein [Bacteroidales bacterium]|nr:(2Fe-2S) ferredoxin domain-containing protein [Bacteroidales bacterium]